MIALHHLTAMLRTGLRTELVRMRTWIFVAVFLFLVYQLYWGRMSFGGMRASGVKLATNADFTIAAVLGVFCFFLMHLTATVCGEGVIEDRRLGLTPLFGSAPLPRTTYLLGRFLGSWLAVLAIYSVFALALFLGQLAPAQADKLTLAPRLEPYLRFGLWFVVVPTFFVGAVSFCLGTLSGSMKIAYGVVTAFLVIWFLVLSAVEDRALRWVVVLDPSLMEWLGERVAKSRGNAYLNANPIRFDTLFWINRAALVALGVGALALTLVRYRPEREGRHPAHGARRSWLGRAWGFARGASKPVDDPYAVWSSAIGLPKVTPRPRGIRRTLHQLRGSLSAEFTLLRHERGLWIMVPLIMALAGASIESFAGPFRTPIYPVSSEFARQMVPTLFLLLGGTVIFYSGELFFRDEESGLRPILYASPVGNATLLGAKWLALFALSASVWLLTAATAMVAQVVQWKRLGLPVELELEPYVEIGWQVVLPGLAVMVTLALFVNVLARQRHVATFFNLLLAGGYLWLVFKQRLSLLHNPLALGHWSYSDLTALAPYAERLRLAHGYWGALVVALFAGATALFDRGDSRPLERLAGAARRGQRAAALSALLALGVAALFGLEIERRGNARGSRAAREAAALERESRWLTALYEPRFAVRSARIELELNRPAGALASRGSLRLFNPYAQPIRRALFGVAEGLEIEGFALEGAASAFRREGPLLLVELDQPVPSGATRQLDFAWSGRVRDGFPENGGAEGTLLLENCVFLSSFEPWMMPTMGLPNDVFLLDRRRRHAHGLAPLEPLRQVPLDAELGSLFGIDTPFALELSVLAPAHLVVASSGDLTDRSVEGDRVRWTYKSRADLRTFAVQAFPYAREASGADSVLFDPAHRFNVPVVQQALADGREHFERWFAPYPHGSLCIAEFPRTANFAQSFPTLMPFSEAIGFLTNHRADRRKINATYFVTAHEVAHQWWGYILHPGASLGGQVLCESLAEYSAGLLVDQRFGEDAFLAFLQDEEDLYLRRRDPDIEPPLSQVGSDSQSSGVVWYQKGCLVFRALEVQFGRACVLAALSEFAARWRRHELQSERLEHATLADLWSHVRRAVLARHPAASSELDQFYANWFEGLAVPDPAFAGEPRVRREGTVWSVDFELTNLGPLRVPVTVEAYAGEWRPSTRLIEHQGAPPELRKSPSLTLMAESGTIARGMLLCDFEPRFVVIDRAMGAIDFDRTNNASALEPAPAVSPSP